MRHRFFRAILVTLSLFCVIPAIAQSDAAVSMVLKNAPLGSILEELARKGRVKLVMDKGLAATPVSCSLPKSSPKQAIQFLLQHSGLSFECVDDNLIVVTDTTLPATTTEISTANTVPEAILTEPSTADNKKILVGRIEHAERMAPLGPDLRAGAQLDLIKLKKLTPNNLWYKVPAWWAGTWHSETNTTYHVHRYKVDSWESYLSSLGLTRSKSDNWEIDTFTARADSTHGFQRDRSAQIWEYAYGSYVREVEGDNFDSVQLVRYRQPIEITDSKLIIKYIFTEVLVSRRTKRIGVSRQVECINTYSPAGGNLLRVVYSAKIFDQDGKPERLVDGLSMELRTAPFKPWNIYKGQDLTALFREYMESHGLRHLLP